ncbi:MAG TPA: hypothetical protein VMR25_13570 [Planctomycetaceae bacterium]|jgi:hypothetical protein|nr:hypothetical protein [Planctomycetaceae bacterium]
MRSDRVVLSLFAPECEPVEPDHSSTPVVRDDLDRRLNQVLAALYGVRLAPELADVAMQLHRRLLQDAAPVQVVSATVPEERSAVRIAA